MLFITSLNSMQVFQNAFQFPIHWVIIFKSFTCSFSLSKRVFLHNFLASSIFFFVPSVSYNLFLKKIFPDHCIFYQDIHYQSKWDLNIESDYAGFDFFLKCHHNSLSFLNFISYWVNKDENIQPNTFSKPMEQLFSQLLKTNLLSYTTIFPVQPIFTCSNSAILTVE